MTPLLWVKASSVTLLMAFVKITYEKRRDILPKKLYKIRQEGHPFQEIYRIPLFLMPLRIPFQSIILLSILCPDVECHICNSAVVRRKCGDCSK